MTRTIFFDLDATLYSYSHGHKQGLQSAFRYWNEVTREDYDKFFQRYMDARSNVKRFLNGSVASHSRALYFQEQVDTYFDSSLPFHVAELTQLYWDNFIDSITPFEGVRETLQQLQDEGYQLGIITNMSAEIQHRKLHQLGLDDLFDMVLTSEQAGQQKPHPHIYMHAMNRFDPALKPSECVMVGDNFNHDVEAAGFLGIEGILVTLDIEESRFIDLDCRKAHSFPEILDHLDEIFSEPLDGVIKYKLNHRAKSLADIKSEFNKIIELRDELWQLNLIGVYPPDYYMTPNVGFGNASIRYSKDHQFLISGSQTGEKETTNIDDYALVTCFVIDDNELFSKGPCKPSSESLTHAAVYEIAPEVECVIHVHSKKLWDAYEDLGMPITPEDVLYGTPDMARSIQKVYRENPILARPVAMRGHIEGLLTWGKTTEEALKLYLDALNEISS